METVVLDFSMNASIIHSLSDIDIREKLLKTNIQLSPEFVDIVRKVITIYPIGFVNIEKCALEIVQDGKINTKDIPHFIVIIENIYNIIYCLKETNMDAIKSADITRNALKLVFHLLILEGKIKIKPEEVPKVLNECDFLIDACIGIIFPNTLKKRKCWFSLCRLCRC